jgi:hypothetical protein
MRRALRVTGVLAALLALAIGVGAVLVYREWHRASYFLDARLVESDVRLPEHGFGRTREERAERAERCERVLLGNHRILPGTGLVLSRRDFDPGKFDVYDDERFDWLTISLDHPEFDTPIAFPSPNVRVYYSSGVPGFVSRCAGDFASAASGQLTLTRSWLGRIRADIDLAFAPIDAQRERDPAALRLRATTTFTHGIPVRVGGLCHSFGSGDPPQGPIQSSGAGRRSSTATTAPARAAISSVSPRRATAVSAYRLACRSGDRKTSIRSWTRFASQYSGTPAAA